ncbi:Syntaxin-like protein psy1 [Mycena sanguinolenta]|uniref:Syntaxin-like protein psy1 n=1 Tax=Mycena sanguinolenta TaxID=230812 RepID=A0A8H6Y2I9_9AGAR|nr:Syntaxin-like protein psy1 [Mycena sanguinolenta]
MATDRMAAYKAKRQADQPANTSHELTNINATGSGNAPSLTEMNGFMAEVTSVQDAIGTFSANVTRISTLNTRSLNALGDEGDAVKQELDGLVAATMALSTQLKDRLKQLQAAVLPGARGRQEKEMRQNRVTHALTKFKEALQTYQQVEQDYRVKSRQRVERQYKIVKPDATPEEIADAIAGGGDQVFMQALTTSPSYAQARSAFNEVQSRAQDLRRVEQTIEELAQLFLDMAFLVEQQDEPITVIEDTAIDVEKNAKEGLEQTTIAVRIARNLRRKRWICFFIVLIVAAVLAIVLAIVLTKK